MHPTRLEYWDTVNNVFVARRPVEASPFCEPYFNANATYALMYAFEPDWGWLQERQTHYWMPTGNKGCPTLAAGGERNSERDGA